MRSQSARRSCSAATAPSCASEMKPTSVTSASIAAKRSTTYARRLLQLGQQLGELRPVGAESAGDQTDRGLAAHFRRQQSADVACGCVGHGRHSFVSSRSVHGFGSSAAVAAAGGRCCGTPKRRTGGA